VQLSLIIPLRHLTRSFNGLLRSHPTLPKSWITGVAIALLTGLTWLNLALPAQAAPDPYVLRYLDVNEPVELTIDDSGATRPFSIEEISKGKRLFEDSCKNCHVGGATLPNPLISLSLETLKGATPPRDNIASLVAYMREPLSYDGTEEAFGCRQVPESWLSQTEVENLSAFILRAAQTGPGWGATSF
jgi:photosystem II cytochrome c550